jgi:hypothetical protein
MLRYTVLSALLVTVSAPEVHAQGSPDIEMPDSEEPRPDDPAPGEDYSRGLQEERFARAQSTSLGGYGELHYNLTLPEGGESSAEIDLHRLVTFIAHNFTDRLRFYGEIEVEHALSKNGGVGEVGIEQAFVDYRILDGDALTVRAGVVLVPVGIVNQWHEPPIFHGVERPMVDKVILPSTWREAALGVTGEPAEGLRYELYLMGGLDPSRFSGSDGLRKGRQGVAEATVDGWAVAGRLEYEPMLGLIAGISGYASPNAGANAEFERQTGVDMAGDPITEPREIDVPNLGASADVRLLRSGFEARAVAGFFFVGDTNQLRLTTAGIEMGQQLFGAYGELAYDVLHGSDTEHQLLPFVRYERYDTTFATVPGSTAGNRAVTDLVFGLSYRPIPQVVFKSDVILRNPAEGDGGTLVDLGLGWMF